MKNQNDKKGKVTAKSTKSTKKYVVKTPKSTGKGVVVGKRAVDSAKTKTGAFKPMSWKGKKVTSGGRTTAYKDQSGTVHKATSKLESKKLDTKYAYDRRKFVADSTKKASVTKRFAKATRKGS